MSDSDLSAPSAVISIIIRDFWERDSSPLSQSIKELFSFDHEPGEASSLTDSQVNKGVMYITENKGNISSID